MTDEEEQIFLAAREAVGRSAWIRFWKASGAAKDDDQATKNAADAFRAMTPLLDTKLLDTSLWALAEARGKLLDGSEPFPSRLWLGGANNTEDGRVFSGNISQFVKLLQDRAHAIAPKTRGWVIEPVTNIDGNRINSSTVKMHALFLDCDGTGEWNDLLGALTRLNFCFVAYQSGGWSPTNPKWRIVLPLHEPHDTQGDKGIASWKSIYNSARVVVGAVARLKSVGFDPATETPCCPWFLTEKRSPVDTERVILWRPGHALDLTALAIALPEIPIERLSLTSSVQAARLTLDEERLNEIINALATATNRVPAGRRDLYLALPGALLDRGVPPDDVYAIVEAVSAAYPRPHADKHADNLHNARTTISRFESGANYTRIGTLASVAPGVASALDSVLPNLSIKAIVDGLEEILFQASPIEVAQPTYAEQPQAAPAPANTKLLKRRSKLSNLGREISPIASRMKASKQPLQRLNGILIGCLLDGVPLPTTPMTTASDIDEMVCTAMRALGRNLRAKTRWPEILDFANHSLSSMDFTQSIDRVALAERAFYEGQGKRNRSNAKRAAATEELRQKAASFLNPTKGH